MKPYRPAAIYVERSVENNGITGSILSHWADVPVHFVDAPHQALESLPLRNDPITEGKKNILIGKNNGPFIKRCPCTREYICCNYYVINLYNNCPLECTYCILQNYINNPFVTVYVNEDDLFCELEKMLGENPNVFYRLGTGELGDSLALDRVTGYSPSLVSFFARQKNALLELKTKTGEVDDLLALDHNRRTIVSWSVNPESLIKREEPKTALLEERLHAAYLCQKAGYFLGLHFDPLIVYPGWEDDYHDLIKQMYQQLNPDMIMWVSLGSLRYPPALGPVIRRRFPKSSLVAGELIPGSDGKMRYLKPVRRDIYVKVISWIRTYDPDPFIYFCMESKEMWQRSIGWAPDDDDDLDMKFQQRVRKKISDYNK